VALPRLPDPPRNQPCCFTDLIDLHQLRVLSRRLQSLWRVTHKKADKLNQRQLLPFKCQTQRIKDTQMNKLLQCALQDSSDEQCMLGLGAVSLTLAQRSAIM
jgi:hypothetical protein